MKPPLGWSLGAFVLYLLSSLLIGEHMPLSRYDMFADAAGIRAGSAPQLLANGKPAQAQDYVRYSDIDTKNLLPAPTRCDSLDRARDIASWIDSHQLPKGTAKGRVAITIVYWVFRAHADGLRRKRHIVASGWAWPKR